MTDPNDLSLRFLFTLMLGIAIVAFAGGMLVGAMLFTGTCTLAPRVIGGQFVRPELHCPLPFWVYVPTV